MDKFTFFLAAMQAGCYKELAWLIAAFSITRPKEEKPDWHPYLDRDGKWKAVVPEVGEVVFDKADPKAPLFDKKERIQVKAGGFPGLAADVDTNLGRIVWHHIVCVYAFGDKIPFRNERLNPGRDVEPIIAAKLTSNPVQLKGPYDPQIEAMEKDPTKIYVYELWRYTEATGGLLAGVSQLFTPAATRKSLTTDPKVYEVRAQLLEKYKDQLHDPAVIAMIKAELGKIDREWLKGDPSEDYLINGKSWKIVRMKTLLMHGEENGFGKGNQVTLIPTSLNEGWNLDNLPDYANSLREGSFNRGYQTMLGGEATQFLVRVFQNNAITVEDCGTKVGLTRDIPVGNATKFIGYYVIEGPNLIQLNGDNISKYAGKTVTMRSPMYCKGDDTSTSYCSRCMGDQNARFPTALGTMASDIGSMMMYIFMKKAHATELKTVRLSIDDFC